MTLASLTRRKRLRTRPLRRSAHGSSTSSFSENRNIVITGVSGSGKTESYLPELAEEVGEAFIDFYDPQEEAALKFAEYIIGYDRVIFDDLSDHTKVLPVALCCRTGDPWEDSRARDALLEVLGRKDDEDLHQHPLKRQGVDMALQLWQATPLDFPLHATTRFFKPWDSYFWHYVNHCPDASLAKRFKAMYGLHEATRMNIYGAAERLLEGTLGDPVVIARDRPLTYDMETLVREKWVRITVGGRNVSREAIRMVMAMRSAEVFRYVMEHDDPIRMVKEECINYGLAGEPDLFALNTGRKRGFGATYIRQYPPQDESLREAMAGCTQYTHRAGSREVAEYLAGTLLGLLDPYKVHYSTERRVHDGYEPFRRPGNQQQQWMLSRYETVRDDHYQSLSDQERLIAAEIQRLGVGERYVNANGRIHREKVELPRPFSPWRSVRQEKVRQWLETIRSNAFYVTPVLTLPTIPPQSNGNGKHSNGSPSTLPPTSSSSGLDSSPAIRRPNGASRGGRGKGKRNA